MYCWSGFFLANHRFFLGTHSCSKPSCQVSLSIHSGRIFSPGAAPQERHLPLQYPRLLPQFSHISHGSPHRHTKPPVKRPRCVS